MKKKPNCFGGMLGGNVAAERECDTCPYIGECSDTTAAKQSGVCENMTATEVNERVKAFWKKKKPLDPKWVQELMSQIIGPQITIMMMRSPKSAKNLTEIILAAVTELYKNNDYDDTNAWVVAASDRVIYLYNTFMTAKLIDLFDKGIPDAPRILTPGSKTIQ